MFKPLARKLAAFILVAAIVIGLFPSLTLPVKATTCYSTGAGIPLELKISELSCLSDFDIGAADYVYGFTMPTNGSNSAQIYFYSPGDIPFYEYMVDENDESRYNWMPVSNDDAVYFLASTPGTYTFTFKIMGVRYSDGYYFTQSNLITIEVSGAEDPSSTPFYIGNALHFADADDCLYTPSVLTTQTDNFTMETWVKADTCTDASSCIRIMYNGESGPNGYGIYLVGAEKYICILYGGVTFLGPQPGLPLQTSQWYHLALVRESGITKLYVNGQDIPIGSNWTTPNVPNGAFSVGNRPNLAGENFKGSIDETRFWTVARSQQQIRDNMYIKLNGNEYGLLAYYNYDQANIVPNGDNTAIQTVTNVKTGGTDLILSGFAKYGTTSNFVPSLNLGTFQFGSATYSVSKGQTVANIAVTRTGGCEGTAVINYATADGTAIAGTNYTACSGSLTFQEGETEKVFQVPILQNTSGQSLNFSLSLTAQQGIALGENVVASVNLDSGAGPDSLPVASGAKIYYSFLEVGCTLQGAYSYFDADGDAQGTSLYQWYRADDDKGAGKTPIASANNLTYQLQNSDLGKYISCEITPVELWNGASGSTVTTGFYGPISDADAPEFTVAKNTINWTKDDVTLTISAWDPLSGLNTAGAYSFNFGEWTNNNTQSYSFNQTVNIRVRDNYGNITEQNIVIDNIDMFAPNGMITDGSHQWNSYIKTGIYVKDPITLFISGIDVGDSGIRSIEYYKTTELLTDEEVSAITGWSNYIAPISLDAVDAQNYTVYARLTDFAGNVSVICTEALQYDMQAPSIFTDYTEDAGSMTITVTDGGSGTDTVTYTLNGQVYPLVLDANGQTVIPLPEGKYPVLITATDILGNSNSITVDVVFFYTVRFKLYNGDTGEALKTETVEYGSGATAPADPVRSGYRFTGWDKSFGNITADTEVNATWAVDGITVTPYTGVFDGSAHDGVTVAGTLPGDEILYSREGISYFAECPQFTDTGSYQIIVKVQRAGCTAWISQPYYAQISRAQGSIFISDASKIYDGLAVSNPQVSTNSTGTITYTYFTDNNNAIGTVLAGAPTDAGTYWVRVFIAEDINHTAVLDTKQFTISPAAITGEIILPQPVLTGSTASFTMEGVLSTLLSGVEFSWQLDGAAISGANGTTYIVTEADYGKALMVTATVEGNYTGSITSNSVVISENQKPTGSVTVGTNKWNSFLNGILGTSFFKDTVKVTMDALDTGGSGVDCIQYIKTDAVYTTVEELDVLTGWTDYEGEISMTPVDKEKFIFYVKITDNAGNIGYVCSWQNVFDTVAPVITSDYTPGATSMIVHIEENGSGLISIGVNSGDVDFSDLANGNFTITYLREGGYDINIYATDNAGNTGWLTVNIASLYTVTFKLYDGDTQEPLKTETVQYGNGATAPADPVRSGYRFTGWDKNLNSITADTVVNATWAVDGIAVTPYIAVYDGLAHDGVTVTGILPDDTVTYSTDGLDYTQACPQLTDVSSLSLYVKVERNGCEAWTSDALQVQITPKEISADMVADIPAVEYSGTEYTPGPVITYGAITLTEGTDYTVSYSDNTQIGLASVLVSGIGNYTGTTVKNFAIYLKQTQIQIEDDSAPGISADGLDDLYDDDSVYTPDDRQIEQNGGSVQIELKAGLSTDTAGQSEIEKLALNKDIGLYLDLSLYKTVTLAGEENGTTTQITHLNNIMTVIIPIPENIKGKAGIVLYRMHNGVASAVPIGEENAVDGEYCVIDENNITLFARNFSTYAVGYDKMEAPVQETNDRTSALPVAIMLGSIALAAWITYKRRKASVI